MIFKWFFLIKYTFGDLKIRFSQRSALFILSLFSGVKSVKKIVDFPAYGNPEIGRQLVEGKYIFAGVRFDLNVDNPWLIEIPSPEVEQNLHGFFWLNDLASLGNSKAKDRALVWVRKWFFYNSIGKKIGWDANITALRCINLVRNWKFLYGVTRKKDQQFQKELWLHYKFLKVIFPIYSLGLKKLNIIYSIFLLSLAFEDSARIQKKLLTKVCTVLLSPTSFRNILSNRSPEDILTFFIILIDVLKIQEEKKYIKNNDLENLQKLKSTIAPVLRGLRLGNGVLTRTHGGDFGPRDLIDKYLVDADVKAPAALTSILGFERITAGRLILIVDCAKPAEGPNAASPHASCLSFELSSGQRPIFVNCGPGGRFGGPFKRYCRSTQAHNSCTLGNISQLHFEYISRKKRWPKEIIINGPKIVSVSREKTLEATWLNLSHDAYEYKYGYVHNRKLLVLNSGTAFSGTDSFEISKNKNHYFKRVDHFYAYFQLHPDVELWDHPRLQTIILRLRNGEHWIFETDLGVVSIEESTFINSSHSGPRSTKRIVIRSATLLNKTEIKWSLRRREIVNRNTRDAEVVR